MNVWLLILPSVFLPIARDEASAGLLAPRVATLVVLGAYLAYLARRPGWLPRA
ncbi:MAG: hypothetical protein H0U90_06000 [Actinobacteria bacterium]|nr:hypothetical protein [Actinomycetota bacterium]